MTNFYSIQSNNCLDTSHIKRINNDDN